MSGISRNLSSVSMHVRALQSQTDSRRVVIELHACYAHLLRALLVSVPINCEYQDSP